MNDVFFQIYKLSPFFNKKILYFAADLILSTNYYYILDLISKNKIKFSQFFHYIKLTNYYSINYYGLYKKRS